MICCAQEKELAGERAGVDAKLDKLGEGHSARKNRSSAISRSTCSRSARASTSKRNCLPRCARGLRSSKLDDTSQKEVERLAGELAKMERVLEETKALKAQEGETFSLVPYHGKFGVQRTPVYVECTADGLIFQPENSRLDNPDFDIQLFRNEVQRRGVALVRANHDPDQPSRPPVPKNATTPYVLFLVRPDGLESYYNATTALRGFDLDFGYELIDAGWAFDFSLGKGFAGKPLTPRNMVPRPPPPPITMAQSLPPPPPLVGSPVREEGTNYSAFGPSPGGPSGPAPPYPPGTSPRNPMGAVASGGRAPGQVGMGPSQVGSNPSLGYPLAGSAGNFPGSPGPGGGPGFDPLASGKATGGNGAEPIFRQSSNAAAIQGGAPGLGLSVNNNGSGGSGPGYSASLTGPGTRTPAEPTRGAYRIRVAGTPFLVS